jgi:hypothetical protein
MLYANMMGGARHSMPHIRPLIAASSIIVVPES